MAMGKSLGILALAAVMMPALAAAPAAHRLQEDGSAVVRITQVDSSRFPHVTVYLSVTDASGNPLGIDPQRIVLREDGRAIPVDEVRGLGEAEPLSTVLVIDVSGSMNLIGKLQAAKEAARSYVSRIREADQAGVIAFNTQVRVVQPLTQDRQALEAAIDSLQASDDTALYDGVAAAIEALDKAEGRRAVLVLSDGMDNSSRITPEQALAGIGPAGLSISTIGLGDPARAPGEWAGLDVETLRQMAEQAGGSYSAVSDAEALRALYLRLGRELQSEYVLSYTSPSQLRDGVDRSLSVSLAEVRVPLPAQAEYNPGGLVPEVPQPAPWPVFLGALAVLAALVVIPMTGRALMQRAGRRGQSPNAAAARGRIRLEVPKEPRVRLR